MDPEAEMERVLEEATQDLEDSQLIDLLSRLAEQPLDLNTASLEELQQIPGITPMMAMNVVSFREERKFNSVDEILIVEGFTPDILLRIRQYVKVIREEESRFRLSRPTGSARSRSSQDLQTRRGFKDGTYIGTPLKVYNRIILRSSEINLYSLPSASLEVGILAEKDAGERRIADFTAGYVDLYLSDLDTRVIAGDYIVEAGEGMVFWRGIGFSKGSSVISTVRKGGVGIRPYLSTDENMYFRGVAAQVGVGPVTGSILYSNKPLSASLSEEGTATSLYSSGLFRTASEEERRNATREELLGGRVVYQPMRSLRIGASGYLATFAHPFALSSGQLVLGRGTEMKGIDVTYIQRRYTFFSEAAMDERGTLAGIGGVLYQPSNQFAIAVVVRSYPSDFLSLHGYGFGESGGSPQNESGAYVGIRYRIAPWWIISTYYDQYVFPRHSSSVLLSSSGYDVLTLSEIQLTRKLLLQAQYKHKKKSALITEADELGRSKRAIGERQQQNYRLTLQFTPSITFRWRSRVELVNVIPPGGAISEQGMLAFQDVRMIPFSKLLLNARVIMFDTDSFDSRVYEFETDLRGTFSNPALFGKGIRWYVVARYEIANWFDLSLKYAQTLKDRTTRISSGSNEILGGLDNRLSVQVDLLF